MLFRSKLPADLFKASSGASVAQGLAGKPARSGQRKRTEPGTSEQLPTLPRNFLHAARIRFRHPRTGQWIEVRAPLPPELDNFLSRLGSVEG